MRIGVWELMWMCLFFVEEKKRDKSEGGKKLDRKREKAKKERKINENHQIF